MSGEFREFNSNTVKKDLLKDGIRVIPRGKLRYLNPIAAHITKELGKNYSVLTLASAERGGLKRKEIETVFYPRDPKAYRIPKGPHMVDLDQHLLTVVKSPKNGTVYIRVTSKMGEKSYTPEVVRKAKKVVEEVLKSRGIRYTKEKESYFVKFKHDLAAKERTEDYGNYNRKPMIRKTLERLPKHEYTEFRTGHLRDLRMKYHR